jgi:cupin fold WbuC family metalloprotein
MSDLSWISKDLLRELTAQAQAAPRKRKNHNIHVGDAAPCQRLLNAVEPESYIPPHCHRDPGKEETLLLLSGRVGIVFFDDQGAITGDAVLDANALRFGVTIAPGTFHTLVALTSGTVFFEAKAGPYAPLRADERASWAPVEGDPASTAYLAMLKRRFA